MKNEQLSRILEDLGLTENESSVYLATLSLGPTTILKIAKTAGVRRTTVYPVVESLKNKGLMYIEPKGLKQLYVAEHPDRLKSMLKAKENRLENVLPEFTALYNLKGQDSTVKHYEGLEAIKSIYDTILEPMKENDDYLVISDLETFFEKMDREYFESFLEKRIRSRVKARLISTESERAEYMKKYSKNMHHEIRTLPKGKKLSVDVMIVPHKVTIFNLQEPISAISIENKSMIDLHKEMFELIWESLSE